MPARHYEIKTTGRGVTCLHVAHRAKRARCSAVARPAADEGRRCTRVTYYVRGGFNPARDNPSSQVYHRMRHCARHCGVRNELT